MVKCCFHKQFFYSRFRHCHYKHKLLLLEAYPGCFLHSCRALLHKLYFAWDIVKSGLDWTLGLNILTTETVIHALWVGCWELSKRGFTRSFMEFETSRLPAYNSGKPLTLDS